MSQMLKPHPFCSIFPILEGDELKEMVASIKAKGLLNKIVMHEGLILDGQNRYKACLIAGKDPKFCEYDGNDPLGFVIAMNHERRHYKTGQRAAIAADIANAKEGKQRTYTPQNCGVTEKQVPAEKAAKQWQVSTRSVETAKEVKRKSPEVFEELKQGKVTLPEAKRKIEPPKPEPPTKDAFERDAELKDAWLHPLPNGIVESWNRMNEMADKITTMSRSIMQMLGEEQNIRKKLCGGQEEKLVALAYQNAYGLKADVKNLKPYSICTQCQGLNMKSCGRCGHMGWLSKQSYECTPDSVRKFHERRVNPIKKVK